MIPFLLALALAPWAHPLAFRPLPGWQTGASGDTHSFYGTPGARAGLPLESTAWIAKNVRYRDRATADPPTRTLAQLPAAGIVVWAVIYSPVESDPPPQPIRLDLSKARHLECCDGPVRVGGGDDELTGYGPHRAYSVIVRVYFGSRATRGLRAQAQRALNRLRLPGPR